jgi:hypothetical protein
MKKLSYAYKGKALMEPLHQVFALLDQWRDLPNYQLERRADIFFAVYLARVLEHRVGLAIEPCIIPEFPLKKEQSNQSNKVDYLLLARDRSAAFLVELKTEMSSRNAEQDNYLQAAQQLGMRALLGGLLSIWEASGQPQKYYHLAKRLTSLGLLSLAPGMEATLFPVLQAKQFYSKLAQTQPTPQEIPVQIWYIQPNPSQRENVLDFAFFTDVLSSFDDEVSRLFRACLLRWRTPAGSRAGAANEQSGE